MIVNVSLKLNVDAAAWALEYGVTGAAEVRKDVKLYVTNNVIEHLRSLELLLDD